MSGLRRTEGRSGGYTNGGSSGIIDIRMDESRLRDNKEPESRVSNSKGEENRGIRGGEREYRNETGDRGREDFREKDDEGRDKRDREPRGSYNQDSERNNYESNNDSLKEKKFRNTSEQCSLVIENICDTDSYKEFEAEIKSYGQTTKFWINKRSRTCVVTYYEQDDTLKAMFKFKNMLWPKENGEPLKMRLLQNIDVSNIITSIQKDQGILRPEQDKFTKESLLAKDDPDSHKQDKYEKNDRYDKYDQYNKRDSRYYKQDRQEKNDRYERYENERYNKSDRYYRGEKYDGKQDRYDNYNYEKRERLDKQDRPQSYERNTSRERVREDRDRYNNEQRGSERYKPRRPDSQEQTQPKYQPRVSSNFIQTSFQPEVYYTVQPASTVI